MRHPLFSLKLLSGFAALLLLAACSSTPEEEAGATGEGGGTAQPAASSSTEIESDDSPPEQPRSVVPGSQEDLVLNVGDRVFFDFDMFNLKSEAQATLQRQAAWLKSFPNVEIVVEGHADERGTREYNLGLGERRANAVKEYLVSLGIDPGRIQTISYGKERPVALGHNESAWAQNRRAVTVVGTGS